MTQIKIYLLVGLIGLFGGLIWTVNGYYHKYQDQKAATATAITERDTAREAITRQQELNRRAAIFDAKHYGELQNAKNKINDLELAVTNGTKRLRLSATCDQAAKNPASTTSAPGVVAPSTARLTGRAQRHYFTLIGNIATTKAQVIGLQDWIGEFCPYAGKPEK